MIMHEERDERGGGGRRWQDKTADLHKVRVVARLDALVVGGRGGVRRRRHRVVAGVAVELTEQNTRGWRRAAPGEFDSQELVHSRARILSGVAAV